MTFDEFTPGSLLKAWNERKTMVVNATFRELLSSSDHTWWTIAVARTSLIHDVEGGWSRMFRDLLRLTLGGPSGMQTAGIPLQLGRPSDPSLLFARVVCILSDGDGLRQVMQWNALSDAMERTVSATTMWRRKTTP